MLLKAAVSEASSSAPSSCVTRTEKSPWANLRAAAAISSSGLARRLEVTRLMMRASESTARDTMKNTQIKVCHAPMMRELSVLMNT